MDKLPIILIDSREKKGHRYKFNRTDTCGGSEVCKLEFGDYVLKYHPNLIVIERKKSIDELCGNLGKNRDRFERELQRMVDAGCKFKYIIVEDYYSSINKPRFSKMHPKAIFSSMIALELKYGIHFIMAGSRTNAKKITKALLLKAYDYKLRGVI